MVLLSQLIRTAAITGRTDTINAWFAGRQGGRWVEQTVRAAVPTAAGPAASTPPTGRASAPANPADTLRDLTALLERGVLTNDEFEDLRTSLRV